MIIVAIYDKKERVQNKRIEIKVYEPIPRDAFERGAEISKTLSKTCREYRAKHSLAETRRHLLKAAKAYPGLKLIGDLVGVKVGQRLSEVIENRGPPHSLCAKPRSPVNC